MKNLKRIIGIVSITTFLFFNAEAQKQGFNVVKTFHIQSAGGWDYLALSPVNNKLYVSHGMQVNILDRTSGDSVGVILNTSGVHGIAFAPEFKKGFVSNGKLNNVFVFDINTDVVLDSIKTGVNPDAMCFDTYCKKLFIGNGKSQNMTVIDPSTYKVVATILLNGKPEAIVSDLHGKVYVNLEDKNEIAVIDTKTMSVVKRFSVALGEEPAGLAIDNNTHRLFAGCGNKKMIILDAISGKQIADLPIGDHCDGLSFDSINGNVIAANGDGTLTIIHQINKGSDYKVMANVATRKGARTVTEDVKTHWVYLPTADFEPQPANSKERPKMIPGTFQILVIAEVKS